ncbi:MAG: hypothetical protein LBS64_05830 [Spirochaetaceae bacterium]|jgi:hypothetical protein|nr:hypothetical protein [Spirochaetaceae bacterium]
MVQYMDGVCFSSREHLFAAITGPLAFLESAEPRVIVKDRGIYLLPNAVQSGEMSRDTELQLLVDSVLQSI